MSNKVLLIEDVENLGRQGDIVSVKPGFKRNFLLPQRLAVLADKKALNMQARLQEDRKKKAIADKEESEKIAQSLQDVTLTFVVKVDAEGHMYGSVTALDIVHKLAEEKQLSLEKKAVHLPHPIKEVGVYTIPLKLKEGVTSSLILKVISDHPVETKPQEAAAPKEESKE